MPTIINDLDLESSQMIAISDCSIIRNSG